MNDPLSPVEPAAPPAREPAKSLTPAVAEVEAVEREAEFAATSGPGEPEPPLDPAASEPEGE